MALVKCSECGHNVATDAPRLPELRPSDGSSSRAGKARNREESRHRPRAGGVPSRGRARIYVACSGGGANACDPAIFLE